MLIAATVVSFIIIPGKLSFPIDKQGSRGYGTPSNLSGAAAGESVWVLAAVSNLCCRLLNRIEYAPVSRRLVLAMCRTWRHPLNRKYIAYRKGEDRATAIGEDSTCSSGDTFAHRQSIEHSNSGKKDSIRFDSRYRIDFFDSIRFGNLINLPLVHWYSNSRPKLGVIFIVCIA